MYWFHWPTWWSIFLKKTTLFVVNSSKPGRCLGDGCHYVRLGERLRSQKRAVTRSTVHGGPWGIQLWYLHDYLLREDTCHSMGCFGVLFWFPKRCPFGCCHVHLLITLSLVVSLLVFFLVSLLSCLALTGNFTRFTAEMESEQNRRRFASKTREMPAKKVKRCYTMFPDEEDLKCW